MSGKTERTLQRNILEPMRNALGRSFNYNQGRGEIIIGDRLIYIAGANDISSEGKIRGLTLAGSYCDEITLFPDNFFSQILALSLIHI